MWISFDRIMPGLTWCGTRRVVERELTERRRTLLAVAGGMASLLLVAVMVTLWFVYLSVDPDEMAESGLVRVMERQLMEGAHAALGVVMYLLFGLGMALSASEMFRELGTKEGRIRLLSMPESMADKYAGRWLVYVPGFMVLFIMSMILACVLGCLIAGFLYTPLFWHWEWVSPLEELLGPDTSWLTGSAYTIYAVAAASFFVVGAVAFKRLVFVKTYAAILVLDVALSMLAGLALGVFVLFNRDVVPRDWLETAVSVTAQVLMVAVTLFNWVMAYRWLTYTDVID